MLTSRLALTFACAAMLASCGGGGTGTGQPTGSNPNTGGTPSPSACSLSSRQDFVRNTLNEWYLFPTLLNTSVNKASHSSVQSYIDALVAPARAQGRDRFFTYITSIAEEDAFFNQGASAGFGFRLFYDNGARRVFVIETYEGTAALGANIDRGSELLGIGTTGNNIQSVNSLMANGGTTAVINAFGPSNPGVTRVIRVRDQNGVEREVSLSKTDYTLDPVSDRYGAITIDDNGKQVGYLNFRTFINTAIPDLRAAFLNWRQQGVTEFIIDMRYNGGGGLNVADLMGDLMGRNLVDQVYYEVAFRQSKSQFTEIVRFANVAQSVGPTKIAFIGTDSTASASEIVINGMQPHLGDNMALIGENTFGKPVGQSAFDKAECDDRLRAMTIQFENADGNGAYFNGLATTVNKTCRAVDDLSFPLGDPREAMIATALDFLAGRPCTPIAEAGATTQRVAESGMLSPVHPETVAQREMPGLN